MQVLTHLYAGNDEVRTQNLRLASLGQPLKLKLHRATGETDLKDISLSQVLVEPLVMIQTLEEYLWPKVNAPDRPSDAGPSVREVRQTDGQNHGVEPRNACTYISNSGYREPE